MPSGTKPPRPPGFPCQLLGRYRLVWPADVSRYSHYMRPLVATEAEARATAVPLPTANAPVLEYQDLARRRRNRNA